EVLSGHADAVTGGETCQRVVHKAAHVCCSIYGGVSIVRGLHTPPFHVFLGLNLQSLKPLLKEVLDLLKLKLKLGVLRVNVNLVVEHLFTQTVVPVRSCVPPTELVRACRRTLHSNHSVRTIGEAHNLVKDRPT